jgi:hypothetical protein
VRPTSFSSGRESCCPEKATIRKPEYIQWECWCL